MKKQLLNPILMLTGAVAATLLTGCASPGPTDITGARNALGFTTVTDQREMAKWTGDRYLQPALRSIDTYTFRVPDTGYNPGEGFVTSSEPGQVMVEPNTGEVTYQPSSGAAGQYQTETRTGTEGYKIILYRPGFISR